MTTPDPTAGLQLKSFRLPPEYWATLEQTRQRLQEAMPYQRISDAAALRYVISVGSGSVIGGPQLHGGLPPPDKG